MLDFVVPPLVKPRDVYEYTTERKENRPGTWNSLIVTIRRKGSEEALFTYERTHPGMYYTFEPFRRYENGVWHDYCLISQDYTSISVVDLESGELLFEGRHDTWGFCPIELYVPDYHDYSHMSEADMTNPDLLPGGKYWDSREDEYLTGTFGFVSGCVWGDDSSWKLEYVDLTDLRNPVVAPRFGYLELPGRINLKDAILLNPGYDTVEIATGLRFSLTEGIVSGYSLDGLKLPEGFRSNDRPSDEISDA